MYKFMVLRHLDVNISKTVVSGNLHLITKPTNPSPKSTHTERSN